MSAVGADLLFANLALMLLSSQGGKTLAILVPINKERMDQLQAIALACPAPVDDWRSVFTKPSYASCLNYLGALCSEMRSFSVLGFTDLFHLAYHKHDYFISRAVWNERELNQKRVRADLRFAWMDFPIQANGLALADAQSQSVPGEAMKRLEPEGAPDESCSGRPALLARAPLSPAKPPEPPLEKKQIHLILDDSAIRKFTGIPYFVSPGYIGTLGKVDRCLSSVFTCFSDAKGESVIPFEVDPYLPARKLAAGKKDFEFRSKLEIAASQINRAFFLAQEVGLEIGYTLFEVWYTSAKLLNNLHRGGAQSFGQIRSNRTLKQNGKRISLERLVTASGPDPFEIHPQGKEYEVGSFIGELAEVKHPVKVFRVKGKFAGKPDGRYDVSDDLSLREEQAAELLGLRWKIVVSRQGRVCLAGGSPVEGEDQTLVA